MSRPNKKYVDLDGNSYALSRLDDDERALIERIERKAARKLDWGDFQNFWMPELSAFYEARGLNRREITETVLWAIAQDLTGRLGIAQGEMREGDYRDDLELLIATRFKSRRAFCEATGLSEDMLSHVLAKRKNLAIDTLTDALSKIGYTLHITPIPAANS